MTAFAESTPFGAPKQPEQIEADRPLSSVITALKAEIDAAITSGDGSLAELAHDLLLDAEWAQQCIETVRRCAR